MADSLRGGREAFERNRLALLGSSPEAASRIRYLPRWEGADLAIARNGDPIPALIREGRRVALHSSFDPRSEARKLRSTLPPGGYFACLGFSGGFLAREILSGDGCSRLLSIERSADFLSFCLSNIDLSDVLADPRHSLLLDPLPGEIEERILSTYIPSVSGDLSLAILRSRVEAEEAFAPDAAAIRSALKRVSDDFSVQSHFGLAWQRNALSNLEAASLPSSPLPPVRRALVTAAGPSLEAALPEIALRARGGDFLIATDTSLPALSAAGLRPGAVITLDCQHISYYHFMAGYPRGVPLVMDLASPPLLARLASPVHFFSSGHPFCRYLSSRWRAFPGLDTSGGNVTHAALSLASALGASEIRLYGADFSYPGGKSYARGTYIYDYFAHRASRTAPLESLFSHFLHRGGALIRGSDEKGSRYITKPLLAYRERLEGAIASMEARVIPVRGGGVEIRVPASREAAGFPRRDAPLFAAGKASSGWRDFLAAYAEGLEALALPPGQASRSLMELQPEARDLWTTVLPVAASLGSRPGKERSWGREILLEARDWTASRARALLDRGS